MPTATEHLDSPSPSTLGPARFSTFHDAYVAVLGDLLRQPEHHIRTRGNSGPERLNVSFQLDDPRARVPLLAARRTNIVFNLAEALWFLSGRNDLATMRYYAPGMASYSTDGQTVAGAAYGTRLFRADPRLAGHSPFQATLDLIRSDPDTKRAVLPIFGAHEVGNGTHPDVSCTIALQFLLRDGALHAVCWMRANDAFHGLVSDVFSFTLIQELAACLLGVRLGTYTHHAGSMHIGDRHLDRAAAIVAEATTAPSTPALDGHGSTAAQESATPTSPNGATAIQGAPRMPPETTLEVIAEVCAHEKRLRDNRIQHTIQSLDRSGLPPYWQRMVALLEVYRQLRHEPPDAPIDPEILQVLQPAHRWLAHHKWPDRIPATADAVPDHGVLARPVQRA